MSDDKDDFGTDLKRKKKEQKQHLRSEQDEQRRTLPSAMHEECTFAKDYIGDAVRM